MPLSAASRKILSDKAKAVWAARKEQKTWAV